MTSINIRLNAAEIEALLWLLEQAPVPRHFSDQRPFHYPGTRTKLLTKLHKLDDRLEGGGGN